MDMKTVRQAARDKLMGYCRVCRECNGRACAGEMPGMGGVGTGASFKNNVDALASIRLNMRTLHAAKEADTKVSLFGQVLATSILSAPITGVSLNLGGALTEQEWSEAVVQGSLKFGTLAMIGDGPNPNMFGSGLKRYEKREGAEFLSLSQGNKKKCLNI